MTTRESDEIYQRRVYGVRVREPRAALVEAPSESRANVGRCCCGRMVSLRFVRIGEGELKTPDGRLLIRRSYAAEGSRPARWSLWEHGNFRDSGTWTQVRATAREILERDAQANQ